MTPTLRAVAEVLRRRSPVDAVLRRPGSAVVAGFVLAAEIDDVEAFADHA